ncbi:Hypothetical predicted protein, partial [Olea europaea subsp. europaea]
MSSNDDNIPIVVFREMEKLRKQQRQQQKQAQDIPCTQQVRVDDNNNNRNSISSNNINVCYAGPAIKMQHQPNVVQLQEIRATQQGKPRATHEQPRQFYVHPGMRMQGLPCPMDLHMRGVHPLIQPPCYPMDAFPQLDPAAQGHAFVEYHPYMPGTPTYNYEVNPCATKRHPGPYAMPLVPALQDQACPVPNPRLGVELSDRYLGDSPTGSHEDLGVGSMVEVLVDGVPYYGVIRWTGQPYPTGPTVAGIEM